MADDGPDNSGRQNNTGSEHCPACEDPEPVGVRNALVIGKSPPPILTNRFPHTENVGPVTS